MKINKLSVLFLLEKTKTNKQGKCPIKCRATYNGERKIFATGLFVNPNHWFSKLQQAKPPNEENTFINTELSLIKNKFNQAFLYQQIMNYDFSVGDVYLQYKGKTIAKELGLIEVYNQYIERIKKLINIDIQMVTYKKYIESRNHLSSYISWKFKAKDFKLKDLKFNFITDYEYYLKTERGLQQSTLNKAIQRFRKVLKYAINNDYLGKDPFGLYRPARLRKEIVYLSVEELALLEVQSFSQIRLEQVKDMFVLCCYTGLAYQEMSILSEKHVITGFDGNLWLKIFRQKTQKNFSIPLLPKAIEILDKYKNQNDNGLLLPMISNQKFNSYLKEVADVIGLVDKNLTHHTARKTFATTVLLFNDVPMDIVAELLGHSKISITQEYYGKIVQSKVSEHISRLGKKLKK